MVPWLGGGVGVGVCACLGGGVGGNVGTGVDTGAGTGVGSTVGTGVGEFGDGVALGTGDDGLGAANEAVAAGEGVYEKIGVCDVDGAVVAVRVGLGLSCTAPSTVIDHTGWISFHP